MNLAQFEQRGVQRRVRRSRWRGKAPPVQAWPSLRRVRYGAWPDVPAGGDRPCGAGGRARRLFRTTQVRQRFFDRLKFAGLHHPQQSDLQMQARLERNLQIAENIERQSADSASNLLR